MPAGPLVTRYLAGLALGAALVGGYVGASRLLTGPSALPTHGAAEPLPAEAPAPLLEPAIAEMVTLEAAPETGLPESCNEYRREVAAFIACEKVPQATRDAMRDAMKAMSDAWGDIAKVPADSRDALRSGCQQATDAIQQAADAMGCQ